MSDYYPDQENFLKLSRRGNIIPVFTEILGDLETPVSAYRKISRGSRYSFLLESVEGEEKLARYSFVAADPELVFKSKNNQAEILQRRQGTYSKETRKISDTHLTLI